MKKYLYTILWLLGLVPISISADNVKSFFTPQSRLSRSISHNTLLTRSDTIFINNDTTLINGLSITADVIQETENSFVRIILEDTCGNEYLVAESARIYNENDTVNWNNYSEETCNLDSVVPHCLKIILIDANLYLYSINMHDGELSSPNKAPELRNDSLRQVQVAQKVEAINNYNIRNGKLWIAGITGVALKPYAERKAILGIANDSCNTGGFEFYKSGIFVMPNSGGNTNATRDATPTNTYVKSFDWRNRHGKNWITTPKAQVRKTCWAFAAASLIESYINLYFNRNLNYDLSELDFVMNSTDEPGFEGGYVSNALNYAKNTGVVTEDCYPFTSSYNTVEKCLEPEEIIKIENYNRIYYSNNDELKKEIIKNPLCVDIFWNIAIGHSVLFVGYNEIAIGDSIMLESYLDVNPAWTVIDENSEHVGKTAWIIKNSYAEDWGIDGYAYIILDNLMLNRFKAYKLVGDITSLVYDNDDILCTDNDGDGYYFWGIGEKPAHCPAWALEEPDGDDSDYTKGPMNEYGHCLENIPQNDTIYITTDTVWNERKFLYNHVVICENASLTISNLVTFYKGVSITVSNGGVLIVDNGSVDNVIFKTEHSAKIIVKNNGTIKHNKDSGFTLASGAELEILSGIIY
ncbi:MAG: hypothetical protein IJA04_04835 [Bacteroidaceae bacterium]|nr:hypothetical protein [Bacteroidaceae bacterium]